MNACQIRKLSTNNDLRCIIQSLKSFKSFATKNSKIISGLYISGQKGSGPQYETNYYMHTHPFPCQYFNTFKMKNFTPESFRPGVFHSFGIRIHKSWQTTKSKSLLNANRMLQLAAAVALVGHAAVGGGGLLAFRTKTLTENWVSWQSFFCFDIDNSLKNTFFFELIFFCFSR